MLNEVDKYISSFPEEIRLILNKIRKIILEEAPDASESIAYMMPAYKSNGKVLVYFAGFTKHIGLYATPSAHTSFTDELSKYTHGKGSVQFPLNQPIPYDLIRNIVKFKAIENKSSRK